MIQCAKDTHKWIKDMFFNPDYPTDSFEHLMFFCLCAAISSGALVVGGLIYWATR